MAPAAQKCLIFRSEFGTFHFFPSPCSASLRPPKASDSTCGGCFLSTVCLVASGSLSCALEPSWEALSLKKRSPSIWQSLLNVMCHISLS